MNKEQYPTVDFDVGEVVNFLCKLYYFVFLLTKKKKKKKLVANGLGYIFISSKRLQILLVLTIRQVFRLQTCMTFFLK